MIWNGISAIAVTTSLLSVHPRYDHTPSELLDISTTSVEEVKFFFLLDEYCARDAAF